MKVQRLLLASCLGLLAVPALAWEWNYGPPGTLEDGFRRVTPVPACNPSFPNPGYIAIGTDDIGGPNPDVYVVYTDTAGNSLFGWEATYDVQGLGLVDDGVAIVPIPNQGYVFLSNSFNGVWRPALTMIDCKGAVLWSQIYPDVVAGQDLLGNDLIRAQSGNPNPVPPLPPTNPGDLVVAGSWFNGNDQDAFLMRTNAAGNLIVNVALNEPQLNESFNALTEALPVAAGQVADLVAVGRHTTAAGDLQALVARVGGNTLLVGALPQCIQQQGNAGTGEYYESVTRLQTFFGGQFAFVGNTRAAAWLEDIWVTRGNSCALNAQARFGNPGGQITNERGHDIIETLVAKPGAPIGSLAIAADHTRPNGLPIKGARMTLNPGHNLIGGQQWLYGMNTPDFQTLYSLAEDPNPWPIGLGYVFSGLTRFAAIAPDPQDLFLVHDDPAVVAPCEVPWNPVKIVTNWPQVDLHPIWKNPARNILVPTPVWYQTTGSQTCIP